MQSSVRCEFSERMVYYNAMTFTSQLKPGDGYHRLNSTISISVMNEMLFPEVAGFHLDFRLRSENSELQRLSRERLVAMKQELQQRLRKRM